MMSKTHVAGGLSMGCFALVNTEILNGNISDENIFIIATAGLILGSLIPDIDHPKSKISTMNKLVSFLPSRILKHRGFTHSIIGSVIMTLSFYLLFGVLGINKPINIILSKSIFIGIISHILLDMMTTSGVCLLYPSYKRISIANLKTRSIADHMLFIMLTACLCWSVYKNLA